MIAIASDHGGFDLKTEIIQYLTKHNIPYKDYGTYTKESCHYPDFANALCDAIGTGECEKGILICGTGIGMSMAANRHKHIRAGLCGDSFSAKMTREHNNANVLVLGARVTGVDLALHITETFLNTPFSEDERHKARISKFSML